MIDRLKNTLKDDLENLKSGQPIVSPTTCSTPLILHSTQESFSVLIKFVNCQGDSTPKKRGPAKAAGENGTTPKSTPKRKKAQADGDAADDKGSPKKKGRPKKAANDEGGWEVKAEIKAEVKDEQVDEEEI